MTSGKTGPLISRLFGGNGNGKEELRIIKRELREIKRGLSDLYALVDEIHSAVVVGAFMEHAREVAQERSEQ